MADAVLVDPTGRTVTLYDNTWYGHITRQRREMTPYRKAVEAAIVEPLVVCHSLDVEEHPGGIEYYGRCPGRNLLIKVCVEEAMMGDDRQMMVKTAYLCRTTSGGEQLWP